MEPERRAVTAAIHGKARCIVFKPTRARCRGVSPAATAALSIVTACVHHTGGLLRSANAAPSSVASSNMRPVGCRPTGDQWV